MVALRFLLARWRADRGLIALLVVVIAAASGLVGAVPRLLDVLERASLEGELAATTPDRRGMAADLIRSVDLREPGAGWAAIEEAGVELQSTMDPALAAVLDDPVPVVDSIRYALAEPPGGTWDTINRRLTVRSQLDMPDVDLLEGKLPDGVVESLTWETGDEGGGPIEVTAPVHQFATTRAGARALAMDVGDRRVGTVDGEGPLVRRIVPDPVGTVVFELSAVVELPPVEDPVWFGDRGLHRPSQFDTNNNTTFFVDAFVPPEAASELPGMPEAALAGVTWRWRLDESALLQADPSRVAEGARALRTELVLDLDEPAWRTGLDRLIAREEARRATAVEVLGLAVVAVVGVTVALLGAIGVVLATRRRAALALVRGRGTSGRQALTAATVEAVGVSVAGVLLAAAVLALVLPGRGGEELVAGVAVLASAVLVAAAWPDVARPLGALLAEQRRTGGRRRGHLGRPVVEGLVVVVAVVAVVATRQRGLGVDGDVDPLVVATPALLSLATAVVAARLVPVALRILGPRAVRRRRGLAGPLGVARATRQSRSGPVVLLVSLGVGVTAIALAVHTAITTGQATAASQRVGADIRIAAPPLATLNGAWEPPSSAAEVVDVAVVDGTVSSGAGAGAVDVVLVDAERLATLADAAALPSLVWDGVAPAPVVASSDTRTIGSPAVGEGLTLTVERQSVGVVLALVDPHVLGFDDADGRFVVVDQRAVTAVTGTVPEPTLRLVDAPTADVDAIAASAADADPSATVTTREAVRASLADVPLALGVRVGFSIAAAAVAVATLLALVLALAAAAPVRRREAAVLAAVGATRRRIAAVAVAEVVPTVAVAAAVGLGLAVGVASVLGARLDLASFTGTIGATTIGAPPVVGAVVLVTTVLVVAAVAAVATIGRVDAAALLREGE